MLNQIRRMVGMVMTLMQGLADEDYLQKTLSAERVCLWGGGVLLTLRQGSNVPFPLALGHSQYSVPRAPGVGLTLDTVSDRCWTPCLPPTTSSTLQLSPPPFSRCFSKNTMPSAGKTRRATAN